MTVTTSLENSHCHCALFFVDPQIAVKNPWKPFNFSTLVMTEYRTMTVLILRLMKCFCDLPWPSLWILSYTFQAWLYKQCSFPHTSVLSTNVSLTDWIISSQAVSMKPLGWDIFPYKQNSVIYKNVEMCSFSFLCKYAEWWEERICMYLHFSILGSDYTKAAGFFL